MQPSRLNKFELRLYYSLMRSGITFDNVITQKNGDIQRELKKLGHCYPPNVDRKYDSMKIAIQTAFREYKPKDFDGNKAFYAMKYINNRLNMISKQSWQPNTHIKFDIGQIMRHKKYKFRLVLIDAFDKCPCDQQWIDTYGPFEYGTDQPFYKTMICTKDRDPFMSIAAQENLIPIDAVNDGQAVEHPLIDQVFSGYDEEEGRMIPNVEYHAQIVI